MSKAILFLTMILFVCSTTLHSQMRMNPSEKAKQLGESLKLKSDQIKKVEEILTKSQDKISKLMSSGNFRDEATRDKMNKLREESNKEIMKILDNKQKDEYKKILEEQKKRMEERRQNRMN
jgi:Spy/CpxP family protein refolding chaperone